MTNTEFSRVIEYLSAGCGKKLPVESQLVYFDLLGDLPFDVGMVAAKRVLAEHRWATFPTVAEIRAAAVDTCHGQVTALSEAEAWSVAWRVVRDTDPEIDGSFLRACEKAKAPALVVESIKTMGLLTLCYSRTVEGEGEYRRLAPEPVSVLRGQFLKIYGQLANRDRRAALLPPAVHAGLADIRERKSLSAGAQVQALADSFGVPK